MNNLLSRLLALALGMIAGAIMNASNNILGTGIFIICSVLFLVEYYRTQKS